MARAKQVQQQRPRLLWTAALLATIYPLVVLYLLLGWMGRQSLSPEWHRESLPLYALVCSLGAVSSFGLLRWRRWGVYGVIGTWVATAILNGVYLRPLNLMASIGALLLVIGFMLDIRCAWRSLG